MAQDDFPTLAITLGDPAGVGPEVILKALADPDIACLGRFVIVGESGILDRTAQELNLPFSAVRVQGDFAFEDVPITVLESGMLSSEVYLPGQLNAACGKAAREYIRIATQLCLEGKADAMVTAPVNKEAITLSGFHFTGHTEYIAELCGVMESRMLLVNDQLRVVHVTTHCGLREACQSDQARILETIRLGHQAVREMGVSQPRIAVCGLNPHAGENGLFGKEDREVIRPAVEKAHSEGIGCEGPLPADTLFFRAVRGAYDLVVAMYHDQGHIPMKLLDFEHTVNVSLGLPIIRTSVDHGTAFDIVGKNLADPNSMKAALRLAATMARHRKRVECEAKGESSAK